MEINEALGYAVKAMGFQASLLVLYHLLLRGRVRYEILRSYLLVGLCLSFIVPAISIPISIDPSNDFIETIYQVSSNANIDELASEYRAISLAQDSDLDLKDALLWIVTIVSALLLIRSFFYLFILYKLKKKSQYVSNTWFKLFKTKSSHPFSFFSNVFMPQRLFGTPAFKPILAHECEHVRQCHSVDRLFLDLMAALFWFNPFIYLYRKALIEIHEYQADLAVIKKYKNVEVYQEILFDQLKAASYTGLVSHFNFSMIKKRIVMMNKQKIEHSKTVYLLAVLAVVVAIFAFSMKSSVVTEPMLPMSQEPTREQVVRKPRYTPSILPLAIEGDLKVTSGFGNRRSPFTGNMQMHKGMDMRAPVGTIVIAPADGIVTETSDKPGGYGKMIVIDHGNQYRTRYGQLSAIDVTVGEQVKMGQAIGKSGNTGRSTGPHLHYEVIEIGVGNKDPKDFILNVSTD